MDNHELITVFLEAQEPDYFQNMMSAMGRPFAKAIKIGEMVENGLKTSRIKLKQMGVIGPIAPHHIHPNSHGFQANARCEYHLGTPGHSTDDCWTLKRAIKRPITEKLIVVTNGEDPPNVTNNPLPAHNDVHFIGMIGRDLERKPFNRAQMTVGTIHEGTKWDKGAPSLENVTLFVPKVTRLEVPSNVPIPRLYVLGGHHITWQNYGSTKGTTEPIIIRHVVQPPLTNTKTIPWNYNKTVMTYKGKEIIEEVGETGGLTRSGRCYSPEESRKAKQIREGQLPIKKYVTEEEAEEFLKKMKVHDYSIINQLRKTPAQISLLSLLLHSKEHAHVLIKNLNKALVLEKTIVNELEKMANRFFKVNRISSTNDELPEEGAGHNRALHLVVKCEGHYVKRVMIDGGSSVDVCPLSNLQGMKINTDRIRPRNVRIRAFDGSARDTIGEINLTMTIGSVDFEIVFQVVDMDTSYNFLLGRPWIHMARVVPSILYQMEGKPILHPRLSATFVMVAAVILRQGCEPGKGLGHHCKEFRSLFLRSITRPRLQEGQNSLAHANIGKICHGLSQMFSEVNMIQAGEGTSRADMQLIDPDTMLTNWKAAPLPTRNESCFVNAGFNNMTCMRNSRLDLKKLSNVEIIHREVEYDEDEFVEEIKRELEQFENKPKPNLNEIEPINIGSLEEVRETKISIHTEQKTRDALIQLLFEYRDVFDWSYDDMPGLSADLVVHKHPTYPDFPPVQQKQQKFKTDVSDKIKEERMKQLSALELSDTPPGWRMLCLCGRMMERPESVLTTGT
ncbi:uncharacterized protein [Nicotiana sylvestris]|uniref:uncharacterized protein n=1 Tax=Nicotiana sylvestris TaxID=4096 RepID=UPI00388C6AA9